MARRGRRGREAADRSASEREIRRESESESESLQCAEEAGDHVA